MELTLAVDVGEYSDFKDFSNFFTQDIIEFKRVVSAMIFRIYECVLRILKIYIFSYPGTLRGTGSKTLVNPEYRFETGAGHRITYDGLN